jgi:hypothetical protein
MNIALDNLNILKNIEDGQKLIRDEHKIIIDDRSFQGIRRYGDGSSRNDIIYPITWTFQQIFLNKIIIFTNNKQYIVQDAINGLKILKNTYGDSWIELNQIYNDINSQWDKIIKQGLPIIDIEIQTDDSKYYNCISKPLTFIYNIKSFYQNVRNEINDCDDTAERIKYYSKKNEINNII